MKLPRQTSLVLAWVLLIGAICWAYRFTPALGINSVDGWADVAAAGVHSWGDLWAQVSSPLTHGAAGKNANFYRPLAMLWFAGLRAVLGTWGAGWQLASLGLHLLCVGLLGGLARRLGGSPWEALLAAAMLGLHPLGLDVVPAVDRSPDLLGTALVLTALLQASRGRAVLVAVLGLLALCSKETMLAAMPVLVAVLWDRHGKRESLVAAALMSVGGVLYLLARTSVLGGGGGYADSVLRPVGLQRVLSSAALELGAAGWAPTLEGLFPSLAQEIILGAALSAGLLALAWRHRDESSVRTGALLALLPLLLLGLTSAFLRRTIYLPLCGFSLLASALILRTTWGRAAGLLLAGVLLPGSPLVRKDRAWTLAAAMDHSLTLGALEQVRALPPEAEIWLVDRCVQVDTDSWMAGMWREGQSDVYCAGGYSVQAYLQDELGRPVSVRKIANSFPLSPPAPAQVSVQGGDLVVLRPDPGRRTLRSAREAGYTLSQQRDRLTIHASEQRQGAWILVAGVQESVLVQVP